VHDQTTDQDRFVELGELICAGCRDDIADGPAGFTHDDGTALCAGAAEPVEVTR